MNVYRGDVLDLASHFGSLGTLRIQTTLQTVASAEIQWVPEVLCIQGQFKGVEPDKKCWSSDNGATEIHLDDLPEQVNRIVFALCAKNTAAESVQGDFLIHADQENILPLIFHINPTPQDCTGVVVFELIKKNNLWCLKALGINIWGTIKGIYKIQ